MTDFAGLAEQISNTDSFQGLAPPIQVAIFLGAMTMLSSLLVCVTAFTRIAIVLSFTRRALATPEIPPTPVLIGLSLFLTVFVMGPTIDKIHGSAINPWVKEEISGLDASRVAWSELKVFMLQHTRKKELTLFLHLSRSGPVESASDTPSRALVPAFIVSELKTAFVMGFCIYVPFLLVDFVVSTVLMSLGMMMMPPVVVSTPFKILLFVLADGWYLVARSLSLSFR